jgi:hypothetical protein
VANISNTVTIHPDITRTVSGKDIEYTVLSTDFDEVGNWSYQGYVVTPAFTQPSTVKNIEVTELLE